MHPLIYCDFTTEIIFGDHIHLPKTSTGGAITPFSDTSIRLLSPKSLMGGIRAIPKVCGVVFPTLLLLIVGYIIYITHYTPMIVDFIPSLSTDIYIPMTDPWCCYIWCSMDPINKNPLYVSIYTSTMDPMGYTYIHWYFSSLSIDIIPWRSMIHQILWLYPTISPWFDSSHTGFIFGIIHLSYDECAYHWNRIINP